MFEEQEQSYVDRTPYALASILVLSAGALYALNKMNFRFNFGASVGGS